MQGAKKGVVARVVGRVELLREVVGAAELLLIVRLFVFFEGGEE